MTQRVRGESDREERRRTLVEAADALLRDHSYARVRIEDVARRAGVAKGTVFLYFTNKESLVLAVLRSRLTHSFAQIDERLAGVTPPASEREIARIFLEAYQADPNTMRLIALWPAVLEQGAPTVDVQAFHTFLLEHGAQFAARAEALLPMLRPGDGLRLVRRVGVMLVGVATLGAPMDLQLDADTLPDWVGSAA